MIVQLDTENADLNITAFVLCLTDTPSTTSPRMCQASVYLGDGTKNLDGTGGTFKLKVNLGSQESHELSFTVTAADVRAVLWTPIFSVPANTEVKVYVFSPNGADVDVDVIAYLYDVSESQEEPTNEVSEKIMTMQIAAGSTDISIQVPMTDITDGLTPETGLTVTDFDIVYARPHVAPTKADCVALASPAVTDPHLDNGCIEIDSTNMKGVYRFDFPDAPFATGEENCLLAIHHTSCRSQYIHVLLQNRLSADGLSIIDTTEPTTVATTWPGRMDQLWRRYFKKTTLTATQLKTYKNDGTTVVTTQAVSDDQTTETQGAAT